MKQEFQNVNFLNI